MLKLSSAGKLIIMLLACFVLVGCVYKPGGVSASNLPIEGRKYTNLGYTTATDSNILLLGILPIKGRNSTRTAMNRAVAKKGGSALINITVESTSQFWILFIRNLTRVEGEAIRFE